MTSLEATLFEPTKAVSRNRTGDLFLTMEMLYQLS